MQLSSAFDVWHSYLPRLWRGSASAAWREIDVEAAARLRRPAHLNGSAAAIVRRWCRRPPAPATYLHPVNPDPSPYARALAAQLLAGRFSPHNSIAPRDETLPPIWNARTGSGRTERMHLHGLAWLEPLVAVAAADGDRHAWGVATDVVVSSIAYNSVPRDGPSLAWHDHAAAVRTRVLCWFFEMYRRRVDADPHVLRLLGASLHQHALYLADRKVYRPKSNHALEIDGSLIALCLTVPELAGVATWDRLARRRLQRYVSTAFTNDGFSREQSPRYHFFVVRRMAALAAYLDAAGSVIPPALAERLQQAVAVWPWLVRPDGSIPRVGDSNDHAIPAWRESLRSAGHATPAAVACPDRLPNPRNDGAALLVSFDAGYAVFRGARPETPGADDTHVLYKCNYYRYPHFHHDGLSFVLYALGREWLTDPGLHSYEYDRWERRYVTSSSAHNTVEVGGQFDVHPVELVDVIRDHAGDRVTARHLLGHATHTRTVEHRADRTGNVTDRTGESTDRVVELTDRIAIHDGVRRQVRQLFHVAPGVVARVVDARRLTLTAPDGATCTLEQAGTSAGRWELAHGQREPEALGWYSPGRLQLEPITTALWTTSTARHAEFTTRISVRAEILATAAHDDPTGVTHDDGAAVMHEGGVAVTHDRTYHAHSPHGA